MSIRMRKLAVALTAAVAGMATIPILATASAAPPNLSESAVPPLTWASCQLLFQCAQTNAPLDYREPTGRQISLAVIKAPAANQSRRIGSLFINPGGPGLGLTSGIYFAGMVNALGPVVRDRFDIIGIDPRGVGNTEPFSCAPEPGSTPVAPVPDWPEPSQYDQHFASDNYIRRGCAATGPAIMHHMTTADTARDLDRIRQALGEDKISYFGTSYGTELGATYAALFPKHVRALVLDGIVDPNSYATAGIGDQWADASIEALNSMLSHCDRAGFLQCPLTGRAKSRWERVTNSLAADPIALPGLPVITKKSFTMLSKTAVTVDQFGGFPVPGIYLLTTLTKAIEVLRFGLDAPAAGQTRVADGERGVIDFALSGNGLLDEIARLFKQLLEMVKPANGTPSVAQGTATFGVLCTDATHPSGRQAWIDAAAKAEAKYPGFGAFTVWGKSVCDGWPGSAAGAYRGPFNVRLDTPPLLVNLTHDSSTPISDARKVQQLYPGSRLVEVTSWGHTALGKSNRCMRPAIETYLVEATVPAQDLTCKPDAPVFGVE